MTPPRRRRLPTGRLRLRRHPLSLPLGLPTALRRPGSAWPLAPLGLARLCGWCGRTWRRRGGGGRGREARARARLHGSGELRSLHAAISARLDAACVDDAHVACCACSYALCRTCLDEDAAEGRTTCSRCDGEYAVPDPAHGKGSAEEEEAEKVEQHAAGGLREQVTIGSHLSDRQVFLGETGDHDFDGNEIPRLVYVSREKRPGYQHHKKAGAMNALASFTRAKKWVQELQAQGNPNTIMALAGSEDLRSGEWTLLHGNVC